MNAYLQVTGISYSTTPAYRGTGTLSGLTIDSGAGQQSKWSSISWNTVQNAATLTGTGASISFRVATSADGSTWTWATTGGTDSAGHYIETTGTSFPAYTITAPVSRFLQLEVTLNAGSSNTITPSINDIAVLYNNIDPPTAVSVVKYSDSSALVSDGTVNWSPETQIKILATIPNMDTGGNQFPTDTLIPQVEVVTPYSAGFSNPTSGTQPTLPGSVTYTPVNYSYTQGQSAASGQYIGYLSGLANNTTYKVHVRFTDGTGRLSAWSAANYAFGVDTATPTITNFKVKSSSGSQTYVNNSTKLLTLVGGAGSTTINDTGGSSTGSNSVKVQFSEDGNTWGVYSGSGSTNTTDSNWASGSYITITPSSSPQSDIASIWYLQRVTEASNIYIYSRAKDNAGNVSVSTSSLTYSTPGAAAYPIPTGVSSVTADIKGAGGGGGGGSNDVSCGGNGSSGGSTTVQYGANSYIAGQGTGGNGGCDYEGQGYSGSDGSTNHPGGWTSTDGGAANGGLNGLASEAPGGNGGAGGRLQGTISGLIAGQSINMTIGAGGSGGSAGGGGGTAGGAGGNGSVVLTVTSPSVPSTNTLTLDTTAPTITSTAPATNAYLNNQNVSYTLSEATQSASVTVTRTSGAADSNSPHTCNLQGTALNSGTHTSLTLVTGANACVSWANNLVSGTVYTYAFNATDLAGNPATAVSNTGVTYDTQAPTAAITYNPNRSVKSGDSLTITATFSEPMAVSPVPQVAISGNNTLAATNMTKTDTTHYYYTYTVGTGDGTDTVALSTGTDLAGNAITAAPTSGATFTVDNTAPTIQSVTTSKATGTYYKAGTSIDLTVTFSENVTSTGNVTVLTNAGASASCTFTISNASTGGCTYNVIAGQNAYPLNTTSITGTVADPAGNAMTVTTPTTDLSPTKTLVVDTANPNSVSAPASDSYANNTGTQTISWSTFSDPAPSSGFGSYALQRKKSTDSGYSTIYTVTTSSSVTSYTDSVPINLGSGTYYYQVIYSDNAGNTITSPATQAVVIDATAPGGTLTINNGTRATASGTVNLNFTMTDDYSGVSKYAISNPDGSWSSWNDISSAGLSYTGSVSSWPINTSGEGVKTVSIKLDDKAGNEVTNVSQTIYYDASVPDTNSVVAYPSVSDQSVPLSTNGFSQGWYSYGTPYFSFLATDQVSGVSYFRYCMFNAGSGSCNLSSPVSATSRDGNYTNPYIAGTTVDMSSLGEGIFTFQVYAYDFSDNQSSVASYTYKYDKTLPGNISGLDASPSSDLPISNTSITLNWDKFAANSNIAPIQAFKIERMKATGFVVNSETHTSTPAYDGNWSSYDGYQAITCNTYSPYQCTDKDGNDVGSLIINSSTYSFIDNTANDGSLMASIKYVFRVSAEDYATSNFGSLPNSSDFAVYGFTKDSEAPEVPPANVLAAICNKNDSSTCMNGDTSHYGHEIRVSWDGAEDFGSGIGYYYIYRRVGGSADPAGWSVAGKVVEGDTDYNMYAAVPTTTDPSGWQLVGTFNDSNYPVTDSRRIFWDNTVSDATRYSYRIVAFDNATPGEPNHTQLSATSDFLDTSNAYPTVVPNSGILLPDVTAPTLPSDFSAVSAGIDEQKDGCTPYVNGTTCQKINISWTQTNDNTYNSQITYKLFETTDPTSGFTELTDDQQTSVSYDPSVSPLPTLEKYSVNLSNLNDLTTYYFKLEVSDVAGNSVTTSTTLVETGNSKAPSAPSGVTINNNVSQVTDPAHQLYVYFHGSSAPAFDESTKANGIVKYDIYKSTTNIQPDVSGTNTPSDSSDDCRVGERTDDCWIRINNAGTPITINLSDPVSDYGTGHGYLVTGLTESTLYYFRIRATDNGVQNGQPAPLTGLLSAMPYISTNDVTTHKSGWDVTRDLTAPNLPNGGLDVTVHDTHPNSTEMRNIISWKILSQPPLRRELPYETAYDATTNPKGCKLVVVSGVNYCNDFYAMKFIEKSSTRTTIRFYLTVLPRSM